jgi:hypothetical protein
MVHFLRRTVIHRAAVRITSGCGLALTHDLNLKGHQGEACASQNVCTESPNAAAPHCTWINVPEWDDEISQSPVVNR